MRRPLRLSRRTLISAAAPALLSVASSQARSAQRGLAAAAPMVNPWLVDRALDSLARHNPLVWSRDVVAIVDFGLPSSVPRFHLVDILAGRTTSLRVTHGKGSDPDHTGLLQSFSNAAGSMATSEGAYLTGDTYVGVHGLSRRLTGLDSTNDAAEARAIVIHAAWYADPALIATQGKLGRSDGCFAVGEQDIALLLARLGPGRLIFAGRA